MPGTAQEGRGLATGHIFFFVVESHKSKGQKRITQQGRECSTLIKSQNFCSIEKWPDVDMLTLSCSVKW